MRTEEGELRIELSNDDDSILKPAAAGTAATVAIAELIAAIDIVNKLRYKSENS